MADLVSIIRASSQWSATEITQYLEDARMPVRLAFLGKDGAPLLCSLWYRYSEGCLWCATQAQASLVARLRNNPACAFEVAGDQPPYRGVRGQGIAEIDASRGASELAALIRRYLGERDSDFTRWLLRRADQEVAIRIRPQWITAWDFSKRMEAVTGSTAHM